ncbi:NUDIX domain-containing protein [Pseudoduganella sp. DS3]|uniref:NUDIX domain-containing protein n=1 Tax=Pseudoduganella guangdongensis TaxID=2692179 RepID=A0A6N9HG66_9BURK|nr:DinB family protein [Pseudoduganella guangdongensis]MYN02277.1 NUDIX domain-containing protein [Pseudoduganella guangdongensis]
MNFPVSVKGVFCAPDGRVVLLLNERGEWELPGGRIEAGESAAACLAREVAEELGLLVRVGAPLDSYLFEVVPGKCVFIVTYACRLEGDFKPALSEEHRAVGLFAPDALPERLPQGYRASIAAALRMDERRLARHLLAEAYNNGWANHRLLRACAQLSQADFGAPRTGFFPSIKATLNHILTVDWFYIDALEREARGAPPHPDYYSEFFAQPEPFGHCADLWAAQQASDRRLIAYCRALRDDGLGRVVTIDRGDGEIQRDSRQRLLAHLLQHQIHHRGQVHAMLSSTPVAPPQLDEFFSSGEADLRARDFAELGWSEDDIWMPNLT